MRYRLIAMLSVLVNGLVTVESQASDIDAVRALIGEIKVRIEHEEKIEEAADATKPPRKSESWRFQAGGLNRIVR